MAAALARHDFVAARFDLAALNPPGLETRAALAGHRLKPRPCAPFARAGGATLGFIKALFEAVGGSTPRSPPTRTRLLHPAHLAGYELPTSPEAAYNYRFRANPRRSTARPIARPAPRRCCAGATSAAGRASRRSLAEAVARGRPPRGSGARAAPPAPQPAGPGAVQSRSARRRRSTARGSRRRYRAMAGGAPLKPRVAGIAAPPAAAPVRLDARGADLRKADRAHLRRRARSRVHPARYSTSSPATARRRPSSWSARAPRATPSSSPASPRGHEIGNHGWDHPSLPWPAAARRGRAARTRRRCSRPRPDADASAIGDQSSGSTGSPGGWAIVLGWNISGDDWEDPTPRRWPASTERGGAGRIVLLQRFALQQREAGSATAPDHRGRRTR